MFYVCIYIYIWISMCFLFMSHIIQDKAREQLYWSPVRTRHCARCHSLAPKVWDPISPGGSVSLQPGKKPGQTIRDCFNSTHLLIAWNQVLIFYKPGPPWVELEITVIPSLRPLCSIFLTDYPTLDDTQECSTPPRL